MAYDFHSRIEATFQPHRTDDLSDLAPPIGYRSKWMYAWTMGEDDPFPGEVAWVDVDHNSGYGWVPDRDLAERTSTEAEQSASAGRD